MKNYTLYCSSDNAFCRLAQSTLTQHNIAFDMVNVGKAKSKSRTELVRLFKQDISQAPQIFYGTEFVGDVHDIQKQFSAT